MALRLQTAHDKEFSTKNQNRQDRKFSVGQKVIVRTNKRLGNKLTPLYNEEVVEDDLGTWVLIKGRRVAASIRTTFANLK